MSSTTVPARLPRHIVAVPTAIDQSVTCRIVFTAARKVHPQLAPATPVLGETRPAGRVFSLRTGRRLLIADVSLWYVPAYMQT